MSSILVLTATDVQKITATLTPTYLKELMATVFTALSSGSSENPSRMAITTANHNVLFMPARLASDTTCKIVSVPTESHDRRGLPATTIVLDETTGAVRAVVNARELTALRNAAGSLLATTLIGPATPKNIVAFGAGNQIRAHLELFAKAFSSVGSCVLVVRAENERVLTLLTHLRAQFPHISFNSIRSNPSDDADPQLGLREALSTAHIVICATPSRTPLFPSSWIRTGTHVILVGSFTKDMKEADRDLVRRALSGMLLVDSRQACLAEAGELMTARLGSDDLTEVGEFVSKTGSYSRLDAIDDFTGPVTMFKSVGVGLQDVAIARAVVDKAQELLVGTCLDDYD